VHKITNLATRIPVTALIMDRNTFGYKLRRASQAPTKIIPYFRRLWRNRNIRKTSHGFLDFYGKVIDEIAKDSPSLAIGASNEDTWESVGQLQFDFLSQHGLKQTDHLLELGCGNLRAGWRFINYLAPYHYTGIDISGRVLCSALDTLVKHNLQSKHPLLYVTDTCACDFLPEEHYDVVHAHSVYSHLPIELINQSLEAVYRIVKPGGFFDFTFLPTENAPYSFCDEDFYYPGDCLLAACEKAGFSAAIMPDWKYNQLKIRAKKLGKQ
jgi:SAM-dependent methyltransferase